MLEVGEQTTSAPADTGDAAEAWTRAYLGGCLPEIAGHPSADLNRAMSLCREDAGSARLALEQLALEVRRGCAGDARIAFLRFALGILYHAYAGVAENDGRCRLGGVPPELKEMLVLHPEIMECALGLVPLDA